jgi:hypothetical protein
MNALNDKRQYDTERTKLQVCVGIWKLGGDAESGALRTLSVVVGDHSSRIAAENLQAKIHVSL